MAAITEDYISFETAKLLKDKGFDTPVWTCYENNDDNEVIFIDKYNWNNSPMGEISAPTQQMAMKWLRDVHKLHIFVEYSRFDFNEETPYVWNIVKTTVEGDYICGSYYSTYEEAAEAAIKYCLENLI